MKVITISFLVSILILSIALGAAYAQFSKLDALIILHFNQASGPDYTGSVQDVFMIALSGMAIALINYLLARGLRLREQFLATILSVSSMFIASLILIAVFVIIANN